MLVIPVDSTQTLFIAVLLLLLGTYIKSKTKFFTKYCIPGPVVGGLLFSGLALALRQSGVVEFEFNTSLQQFFMNLFFTASGYGASMYLLKRGGKLIVIFLGLAAVLAALQNVLAISLANILNVEPMIALMTGSIPMTGGHGNAAAFAPIAEELGFAGAMTVAVAAATFGLVSGSIMGGPVANSLILKKGLFTKKVQQELGVEVEEDVAYDLAVGGTVTTSSTISKSKSAAKPSQADVHPFNAKVLSRSFYLIFIGLGLGSVLHIIFKQLMPGVTLPIHVMGMLGGVIIRILMDWKKLTVPEKEIDAIGDVCLGVFVSMAVYTMKLWELTGLAVPLLILLFAQVVLMYLFAVYVTFPLMGKNFDSAVITAGHIGFGLGAVPVSMANMNTVSEKFAYSKLAFFVVPIIGGLFSNFTNAAIITFFMNVAK
ncbi:MAG: sodium:glutamate symporter [Acidaminobacter sp.]|uniref:sodium/glutamate symporter n=1 Tax=Acidaminobacter sp. TaxID=1872102 RepID=UPI001382BAD1|nr:sodium/glutamate symporter [Acidaminobacter sp.]MZQ98020.1 sodium:glutamate symporter [Acidaminobacter sp.]